MLAGNVEINIDHMNIKIALSNPRQAENRLVIMSSSVGAKGCENS